ncbi:EVE domain-containing protein [Nitrospinae bacterium AH_259_B05_G02_I21]|nr:EVE domain-containing protein [Nitrospinae bacterium AH_259_B05_G02_I21]MDA2932236.1 EVE domain-containing protein [Nitrospinae bacterium AH-259-F20]MDV2495900.1 EVE domain-containing protein [bacterium]
MSTYWMLVSSEENFERSRARGFDIAGMKSRHRKKAEQVQPGDKVIFYLTKVQAFGGIAEATSTFFESEEPVWDGGKKGDLYPFRFEVRPDVICEAGDFLAVEPIRHKLQHLKKWPDEHWRLAFQGNVHSLPKEDYETIRALLAKHVGKRTKVG